MSRLLWIFAIMTIPLLMVSELRFASIPLTHIFIVLLGIINFKYILKNKISKLEKNIFIVFGLFIIIAILDLLRSPIHTIDFFYEFKLIVLLITLRLYSYFIYRYGIVFFLKWFTLSSGLILIVLLYRSLFILKAPFFVVNPEIITEAGKNSVAFYLALTVPLIGWFIKTYEKSKFWNIISITSILMHLFSGIYVQSKGFVAVILTSFFITLLYYSKTKINLSYIIKIPLIIFIPLYIILSSDTIDLSEFTNEIKDIINQNGKVESGSTYERKSFIFKSLDYFANNPFVGIGTNNFNYFENKDTHNTYLQILAENGIIGFFSFLYLIYFIFKQLNKIKNRTDSQTFLVAAHSFCAFIIYLFLINGFFNAISVIVLAIVIYYDKFYRTTIRSYKVKL